MCYVLYLGTDQELPVELPGDADNDRMWIGSLESRRDRAVVDKFSKSHVYHVASWQDCGCGWLAGTTLFESTKRREESRALTRACMQQLRELMGDLLASEGTVELYLTWEGEQPHPIKRRLSLHPSEIGGDQLAFEIGDFAVVSLAGPG